jgi:hypothetical protein
MRVFLEAFSYPAHETVNMGFREVRGRDLTEQELLDKGLSSIALRRPADSVAVFDELIVRHRETGRAWLEKGKLLMGVFRRYKEALQAFQRAADLGVPGAQEQIQLCRSKLTSPGSGSGE